MSKLMPPLAFSRPVVRKDNYYFAWRFPTGKHYLLEKNNQVVVTKVGRRKYIRREDRDTTIVLLH